MTKGGEGEKLYYGKNFEAKGQFVQLAKLECQSSFRTLGYIVNFENNIGHVYEVKDLGSSPKKKLENTIAIVLCLMALSVS